MTVQTTIQAIPKGVAALPRSGFPYISQTKWYRIDSILILLLRWIPFRRISPYIAPVHLLVDYAPLLPSQSRGLLIDTVSGAIRLKMRLLQPLVSRLSHQYNLSLQ